MISEKVGLQLRKYLPVIITSVDSRKAFDSIHRGKLMGILKAYGVPVEIADAVNMMYTKTTAKVLYSDRDTEFFDILAEFSREILWHHHIYSLLPWITP